MLIGFRLLSLGFALKWVVGCTQPRPAPLPPPQALPHISQPMPMARFEPGRTDATRRARLETVASELDAFFESKRRASGATGLAVGILLDGELAYARGFGVRDVETSTPIDGDTVFRIASMTKSFTALSVLKLRDEGKISLDAPAAAYLPELASLALPTRDAPPVTLRLLLTNASGLAYDDLWGAVTFGKTRDEIGGLLAAGVQLSSTPGTRYAYSNLGWALLGRAVENVTHQGYREYVSANVLQPLGMRSSVWEANEVPAGRLATGYRREYDALVPEPRASDGAFAAAGGLYTSLHDLARYAAYQLAAYPPRDDPESGPVRRSTLREMHLGQRPARGLDKDVPVARMTDDGIVLAAAGYGFGWLAVTSCTEEVRIQHGGFEPGYFNWVVLLPRERVGFVALATSGPAGIESRFGVFDILRRGGLLDAPPPVPHPALAAAPATLAKLLASWDEALALRTFDPDSGKYSWSKEHAQDFERLTHEHGRCVPAGDSLVYGPLHAQTRFTCERGALVFDVLLSPATPPLVQYLEITEEFPADERTADRARRLAAAIEPAGQASSSALFASGLDRPRTQRKLARLALEYGACTLLDGSREVPHRPWPAQAQARYALRSSSGPLELTFTLDTESGAVTSFDAHPPRPFDATCWQ
jgi:CubicO group peptidase (beta-lactamase class C family)